MPGNCTQAATQKSEKVGSFFTGKVAFITGGASGIGLATAKRLLWEGCSVAIADISMESLEERGKELTGEYGPDRVLAVHCDVTSEESIEKGFEAVIRKWNRLDILVNNAGVAQGSPLTDLDVTEYDRQNAIMPRGSFLCTRAAARIFKEHGIHGDIVYIVSKNSVFASSGNLAYSTAKAAQLHQARVAAVELAQFGIRVNVVNPDAVVSGSGIFSGEWAEERAKTYGIKREDLGKYYAQRNLLKAELFPEDIAAAVFVLTGPELRKSTGLVIGVDGGLPGAMLR